MVTPLLASLRKQGGTLYTFSSAAKDLTKIFTDDRYDFRFSHFACLNIPDIKNGKFKNDGNMDKGLYLQTLVDIDKFNSSHREHSNHAWFTDSDCVNMMLAENLQNYVMNFETAILEGIGDNDDYNNKYLRSVSERIFFNWLQKIGAINFMYESNPERLVNIDTTQRNVVIEKEDFKDRTVKYIGKIDIINSVDVAGDAYDEIYLHIPGSVGGSQYVRFLTTSDDNYITNKEYICNFDKIIGRENLESHPYDLSFDAMYDENKKYISDNYGCCIDFNDSEYNGIMNMNESSQENFEFNCVLLYYTMTDRTSESKSVSVTNLYGVLFLEEANIINSDEDENSKCSRAYIQRYPKIAGGESGNGNSYALKVDLKIDTLPDVTMTSKEYTDANDDYAGALEIYTKSLLQIQSLVEKIFEDKNEIKALKERVEYLEDRLSLVNSITTLENEINKINDIITYENPIINGESILDLISLNSNKLDAILNGETSAKLTIDSSVINAGFGIDVSKNNDGITISNNMGLYDISYFYTDSELSDSNKITIDNPISLSDLKVSADINLYTGISYKNGLSILYAKDICNTNLNLYINDCGWKTGQSAKIKIKCNGGFVGTESKYKTTERPSIKIFCEGKDITSSEVIYADTVNGLDSIEVICVDANAVEINKKFIYDIKTR